MSDQDPFNTNQSQETPATPSDDPFADQLSQIKNDDGQQKYANTDEALKALNHSQEHIKTLAAEKRETEAENQRLKMELEKMGGIEDFVNKLKPNSAPTEPTATPKVEAGVSEDDVSSIVQKQLEAARIGELQNKNLEQVVSKLREIHGDSVTEVIKTKALELNMDPAQLKELSKENPTAALKLLGGEVSKPAQPSRSTEMSKPSSYEEEIPERFERGVARGGLTNDQVMDMWRLSKKAVYQKHGLEMD